LSEKWLTNATERHSVRCASFSALMIDAVCFSDRKKICCLWKVWNVSLLYLIPLLGAKENYIWQIH